MPDITLKLNDNTRDKALIFALLASRINQRYLLDLIGHLSGKSVDEIQTAHQKHIREELSWIYGVLGDDGLNPEGLDQLLDLLNPKP